MCRIAETRNSDLDIIGICLCCLDKIMKYGRIESVTPLQRSSIIDFGFRHDQVFYWIEIKNKNKSSTQFIRGFISGLFFSSIIAFTSGLSIVYYSTVRGVGIIELNIMLRWQVYRSLLVLSLNKELCVVYSVLNFMETLTRHSWINYINKCITK